MRTSHNYGLMNRAVCSCKLWPVKFDSTSLLWLFCWNCRDIRAGVFRAGSFGSIATSAPCSWNMLYIDKCNYSEANVFESRLQGTAFKAALWYTLQWKAFKGLVGWRVCILVATQFRPCDDSFGRLQSCNLPHITDCTGVCADRTIVTSHMNYNNYKCLITVLLVDPPTELKALLA